MVDWGQSAWEFLHRVSFRLDDSTLDADRLYELFRALGSALPCKSCRRHYDAYIDAHPPEFNSGDELARWLVDLHNDVNARLGKQNVSFEAAREMFQGNGREAPGDYGGCDCDLSTSSPLRKTESQSLNRLAIGVLLLLLLLCYLWYVW